MHAIRGTYNAVDGEHGSPVGCTRLGGREVCRSTSPSQTACRRLDQTQALAHVN